MFILKVMVSKGINSVNKMEYIVASCLLCALLSVTAAADTFWDGAVSSWKAALLKLPAPLR